MTYMYKLFWRSLITTWNWHHSHINFYNEDNLWLTCHPRGCNYKCLWPTFTQGGLNFDHKLHPEDPNKYDPTVLLTITAYMWHLDYQWYLGLCGYTHAYFSDLQIRLWVRGWVWLWLLMTIREACYVNAIAVTGDNPKPAMRNSKVVLVLNLVLVVRSEGRL